MHQDQRTRRLGSANPARVDVREANAIEQPRASEQRCARLVGVSEGICAPRPTQIAPEYLTDQTSLYQNGGRTGTQSADGPQDRPRKETANRSSTMSENMNGAGGSPGRRLLVRPLMLFAGTALVISLVASRTHARPYGMPFFHLFFSDTLHMKAWLTTIALLLGLGQLLTAARIFRLLRFPPESHFYALLHRWSGRVAILLTLPAAYHCIFQLGFATHHARAAVHSVLGAAFYGALVIKVLMVRSSGYPGWALPLAGGTLFAILTALWLTSAFWFFGTFGVGL